MERNYTDTTNYLIVPNMLIEESVDLQFTVECPLSTGFERDED